MTDGRHEAAGGTSPRAARESTADDDLFEAAQAALRAEGLTTVRYVPPWRVEMTVRPGVSSPLPASRTARLVAAALDAAGAPAPASIGIVLSGDVELAALNREAMGHEGATDVLSFPLLPPEAFPSHEGRAWAAGTAAGARPSPRVPAFALPPGVRPHLGDIVVSVERAAEQAAEGRGGQTGDVAWGVRDELSLLLVHGVLHVCGWDHAEPVEEAAMRRLERTILAPPHQANRARREA